MDFFPYFLHQQNNISYNGPVSIMFQPPHRPSVRRQLRLDEVRVEHRFKKNRPVLNEHEQSATTVGI